jgi:osmotically-inducible protein OsmY
MSARFELQKDGLMRQPRAWVKRPNINRRADADLAAAAVDAIEVLTTVPQESIKVTAHNGWLHLEGTVSGRHQRTILEEVTRQLPGVQGVTDSTTIEGVLR